MREKKFKKNNYFTIYINNKITLVNVELFYSVFGSVVAVAFEITFCVKIHVNDVFLFFKNHF
jgi:hypothetical protein